MGPPNAPTVAQQPGPHFLGSSCPRLSRAGPFRGSEPTPSSTNSWSHLGNSPMGWEGFGTPISSVQSLNHVRLCDPMNRSTPGLPVHHQLLSISSVQFSCSVMSTWAAARQASLSITNSWSLLKLMSIELVMPSNHLILCHPLLFPHSIFPRIRVFSNESVLHIRWPKCWSFSFCFSPSNEYSGLTSFRIDWLNFLAVRGTLKSLLQQHSSKASILQCSAFFIVQLSHPYMTTGKTTALPYMPKIRDFVDRINYLALGTLS